MVRSVDVHENFEITLQGIQESENYYVRKVSTSAFDTQKIMWFTGVFLQVILGAILYQKMITLW